MNGSGRAAIGGAIGLLALAAGGSVAFADALDARLFGAWATSEADCKRLFVRSGGTLAFRQPVDKFAQATIIGPQQIRAPSSTCRVQKVAHEKGVIKITAECSDSISYAEQHAQIRITDSGGIVYSPTGDSALDTTMIKCGM